MLQTQFIQNVHSWIESHDWFRKQQKIKITLIVFLFKKMVIIYLIKVPISSGREGFLNLMGGGGGWSWD